MLKFPRSDLSRQCVRSVKHKELIPRCCPIVSDADSDCWFGAVLSTPQVSGYDVSGVSGEQVVELSSWPDNSAAYSAYRWPSYRSRDR